MEKGGVGVVSMVDEKRKAEDASVILGLGGEPHWQKLLIPVHFMCKFSGFVWLRLSQSSWSQDPVNES